ncbi:MAG: alpha/beta hydrolase [bacterium]|nr:alpha/beta hydrolase [bacterium]
MSRPIILVHGAWHGAWCWDHVVPRLRERELAVAAIDLPFTSSANDVEAARQAIETRPGAVVLGHSYGGAVITEAASGLDVSHLVYLAAFMQNEDETLASLMATAPPTPLVGGMSFNDDGSTTITPEAALPAFYEDCSPEDAQSAIDRLRPVFFTAPEGESARPAWCDINSTYVVCTQDRALDASFQRRLAKRATNIVEWETSHSPFMSQPGLLVDLLTKLAQA